MAASKDLRALRFLVVLLLFLVLVCLVALIVVFFDSGPAKPAPELTPLLIVIIAVIGVSWTLLFVSIVRAWCKDRIPPAALVLDGAVEGEAPQADTVTTEPQVEQDLNTPQAV